MVEGVGVVHAVFSDRSDGDLTPVTGGQEDPGGVRRLELERRRAALAPVPWIWLRQVHGSDVVVATAVGQGAGTAADSCVTACPDVTVSVQVADCAPVLLFAPSPDGVVVAAAHAGWKGLLAGVLEATVRSMGALGAGDVCWWLGPCISPAAYEFSEADLDMLSARFGDRVRSRTDEGHPALDMTAAVRAAMCRAGVESDPLGPRPVCTAASARHWSHRAAGDRERQVGAIWWERKP
jgi:YfiH family protein